MAVILVLLTCYATSSWGQERPFRMRMTAPERDDPSGLKLSELLAKGVFGLAREVITRSLEGDDALPHNPDTPPRGLQVDLFTPETIGFTVHYHW